MCGSVPTRRCCCPRRSGTDVTKCVGSQNAFTRKSSREHVLLSLAKPDIHPSCPAFEADDAKQSLPCSHRSSRLQAIQGLSSEAGPTGASASEAGHFWHEESLRTPLWQREVQRNPFQPAVRVVYATSNADVFSGKGPSVRGCNVACTWNFHALREQGRV